MEPSKVAAVLAAPPFQIPPPIQIPASTQAGPSTRMAMQDVLCCNDVGVLILSFMPLNVDSEGAASQSGDLATPSVVAADEETSKRDEGVAAVSARERRVETLLATRLIHRPMLDLVARVVSDAMNNALLTSAPTRYCLQTNRTPVNVRLVGWNIDQGIAAAALGSLTDLPTEEFFMPFTLLVVTSHNFALRYEFAKHIFEVLTETPKDNSTPLVSLWPRSCPIYRLLYRWLRRYSPRALKDSWCPRQTVQALVRGETSEDTPECESQNGVAATAQQPIVLDSSPNAQREHKNLSTYYLNCSSMPLSVGPDGKEEPAEIVHVAPSQHQQPQGDPSHVTKAMGEDDRRLMACLDRRVKGAPPTRMSTHSRSGSEVSSTASTPRELAEQQPPKNGIEVMDLHYHFLSQWDLCAEDLCWTAANYAQHTGYTALPPLPEDAEDAEDAAGEMKKKNQLDVVTQISNAQVIDKVSKKQQPAPFAIDVEKGSEELASFKPLLDAAFGVTATPAVKATASGPSGMATPSGRSPTMDFASPVMLSQNGGASFPRTGSRSEDEPSPWSSFAQSQQQGTNSAGHSLNNAAPPATTNFLLGALGGSETEGGNSNGNNAFNGDACGFREMRSSSTITFFDEAEESIGQRNAVQLYCFNDKLQMCIDSTPTACQSLTLYGASGVSDSAPRFSLAPKKKGDAIKINLPSNIQWLGLSSMPMLREVTFQYATMSCIVFSALPLYQDCFWCLDAKNAVRSVHRFSGKEGGGGDGGITAAPLSSVAEAARDRMATELRGANEGWTTLRGPWQ